jgi:hypothetical protein
MAESTRTESPAGLSDVQEEEGGFARDRRSPYGSALSTASTSTFHGGPADSAPSSRAASGVGVGPPPRSPGPQGPRRPKERSHTPSASEIPAVRGLVEQASLLSLRKKRSDGTIDRRRRAPPPGSPAPDRDRDRDASGAHDGRHKFRRFPHMPHDAHADEVPATGMYWFVAPVHGLMPSRGWRAHTVNVVDNVAWIFGGCDEKGGWQDVWLFDTGARSPR